MQQTAHAYCPSPAPGQPKADKADVRRPIKIGQPFARSVGGRDAEKEERQKWINHERKRIEDSVNGKLS